MRLHTLLLFGLLFLSSCFKNKDDANWNTTENVSYGSHSSQVFDIYIPKNSTDQTKVFILIHGGGWVAGKKADMNAVLTAMKTKFPDYAFVNLEYQLASPEKPAFPMQLNDIDLALKKIEESGYALSKQYALLGVSAGGHLSLLHAYKNNSSGKIKMACSIVGPTDLISPDYANDPNVPAIVYQATGHTFSTSDPYLKENSPLHIVDSGNVVPSILFYGKKDYLIPVSQGKSLIDKLQTLHNESKYILYSGGHFNWSKLDNEDMMDELKAFVDLHF